MMGHLQREMGLLSAFGDPKGLVLPGLPYNLVSWKRGRVGGGGERREKAKGMSVTTKDGSLFAFGDAMESNVLVL